jgi:tetratricopeptide (TPR) repeat protein
VKRLAALVLAASAAACTPALREPPSVAELAVKPAPGAPSDQPGLLHEADQRWSKRPDVDAVREAEALYLRAANTDEHDVAGLVGATRAKAWLTDHERDGRRRQAMALSAVQTAQWCGRRAPDLPACDYWLAVAIGLQARENRATADDGLKKMVPSLERAIAKDPRYDEAGPDRILALVLLRAPGWPLGPGDPESGLSHAKKAVELAPEYPPNVMALAEAYAANKDRARARDEYNKAKALAATRRAALDPDAPFWIVEADQALAALKP